MAQQVNWPGWEIVRKIGSGSFGSVYEIHREMFGDVEKAALKVISIPQNGDEVDELRNLGYDDASITTHFKGYLEDIVREYALMNKMKGNTNVVYCDDIRYIPNEDGIGWTIYIKMELLNPLMKNLQHVNTEEQVVRLGQDLCNALVLCREHNVLHRDIKPQNIFISDNGNYKLGDFGIAKTVERTTGGTKIGTYKYMAPEVFNNQPYGHSSDVYSLGLVLYWLLNEKRTPFLPMPPQIPTSGMEEAARMRRFQGEPIPEPLHGSEELKRIVLKACAYDPKERFESAAQMLSELKKLDPGMVPFATVMPVLPRSAEPTEKPIAPPVEEDEGTVNVFSGKPVVAPVMEDAPTEYIRDDKTEYIPRAAIPVEPPATQPEPPKKKKGVVFGIIAAALVIIVVLLLLLKSCGSTNDPPATEDTGGETEITQPTETDPPTDPPTEPPTEPEETDPPTEPEQTDPPTEAPPVMVEVPDVFNKTEAGAVSALEQLGLVVERQYQKSETVAEGNVISQSISAGTSVEEGSEVIITISSGRETVNVADVLGKTRSAAKTALEAQGFVVVIQEAYSNTVASGNVISQSPKAGSSQYPGATIIITVSKGKEPVIPTGVKLSQTDVSLLINQTVQLTATVTPADSDDTSVTWSSSDTAVATVSDSGLVKAVAPGTATITVKTNSGSKVATCIIRVADPTIASMSNQTMFVGDSKSLDLPAVTPSSTWPLDFSCSSSDSSVVKASLTSSSGNAKIQLEALKAGTATVTVSYTAGGKKVSTSFSVTVNTPKVTLSQSSIAFTWDCGGSAALYTINNLPSWRTKLPTATSNTGYSVYWKVQNGTAFISGSYIYVTNPGQKVVARAYFSYNGVEYYADCTITLTLVKTTSASNYLRKGPGTGYGYYTSVPKGQVVTITEVYYDYSSRNSSGTHWVWGKVTYGGYTGWIIIY